MNTNTQITKLTVAQANEWQLNTYPDLSGEQRFGQAFLNHFFPSTTDPELFYEENTHKAVLMAYAKYVA